MDFDGYVPILIPFVAAWLGVAPVFKLLGIVHGLCDNVAESLTYPARWKPAVLSPNTLQLLRETLFCDPGSHRFRWQNRRSM